MNTVTTKLTGFTSAAHAFGTALGTSASRGTGLSLVSKQSELSQKFQGTGSELSGAALVFLAEGVERLGRSVFGGSASVADYRDERPTWAPVAAAAGNGGSTAAGAGAGQAETPQQAALPMAVMPRQIRAFRGPDPWIERT